MNRIEFLKTLGILTLFFKSSRVNALHNIANSLHNSPTMPVLFLGHGSPMNAIEENIFVQGFRKIGKELPMPSAILCVSAHWETKGTFITAMDAPKTIHDFRGFPQQLFDVQYPAKGNPTLAKSIQSNITQSAIGLDYDWGLDHGAWSVIKHLFPLADVPVLQLSLDYSKPASYHYALAKELHFLRNKGVLIVGSGNMVHNLGLVAWDKLQGTPYAYDWALEAMDILRTGILHDTFQPLIEFEKQGRALQLAIPTPEHYLPLLYCLALKNKGESISLFNDLPVGGSLFMTSLIIE